MSFILNLKKKRVVIKTLLLYLFISSNILYANTTTANHTAVNHGVIYSTWLILAIMLFSALVAGEIATRINQPPVLLEMLAGVILGNLSFFNINLFSNIENSQEIMFCSELGLIFLLFGIGLESTLKEMKSVLIQSGVLAIFGVLLPFLFGFGVSILILPNSPFGVHLFSGATLCATSVGVSARVFKDAGFAESLEAKMVLAASVIDDILGLIILSVVLSFATLGFVPPINTSAQIILVPLIFLVLSLLFGVFIAPKIYESASKLQTKGILSGITVVLCFLLVSLSVISHLAGIVGAFTAGLILDDIKVKPFGENAMVRLEEFVKPFISIFTPIFFIRTGMQVNLSELTYNAVFLGMALMLVGILGKILAGFSVRKKSIDSLTIGLGMVPRGEVGLIFASAGASVFVNNIPIISKEIYISLILAVFGTTLVTPYFLLKRLRSINKNA